MLDALPGDRDLRARDQGSSSTASTCTTLAETEGNRERSGFQSPHLRRSYGASLGGLTPRDALRDTRRGAGGHAQPFCCAVGVPNWYRVQWTRSKKASMPPSTALGTSRTNRGGHLFSLLSSLPHPEPASAALRARSSFTGTGTFTCTGSAAQLDTARTSHRVRRPPAGCIRRGQFPEELRRGQPSVRRQTQPSTHHPHRP